ncbi:hypothetical protein Pen01_04730 [Phytomonospora endophytica]|nr:hypothetical protein Pen01_04730 [Phytomonospora endophytica]
MFLLGTPDPGDAVKQQRIVVARGEPFELGTRPVQHDRAQSPDFAVDVMSHVGECNAAGGIALRTTALTSVPDPIPQAPYVLGCPL